MEFASCSILRAQPFSTFILPANAINTHLCASWPSSKHNLSLALPFFSTFPRNSTFPGKCQHCDRFTAFSSISGSQDQNPSQKLAVLLEVDGWHFLFLLLRVQAFCLICFLVRVFLFLWSYCLLHRFFDRCWDFLEDFSMTRCLYFRVLMDAYRLGNRQTFNAGEQMQSVYAHCVKEFNS